MRVVRPYAECRGVLGVDVLLESVALFRHDHLRLLGADDAPPHAETVVEPGTVVDLDLVRLALRRDHALLAK